MTARAKPKAGQNRVPTMVRLAPEVRERLEQAAEGAGRSLAQEMELRLERSFELVSIIEHSIKVSADHAAKMTAERMADLEKHMVQMAGGGDLFMAWAFLSHIVREVEAETGKSIREDEFTKNKAEREVIGHIPGLFRRLPETYSQFKARCEKENGEAKPSTALEDLYRSGGLPPLGYSGAWPPDRE